MDDLENLNSSVTALAKKLISLIPEKWTEINCSFEFSYDATSTSKTSAQYKTESGESKNILNISSMMETKPLIFAIQGSINSANKGKVKLFTLNIDSSGKFKTNIEYLPA